VHRPNLKYNILQSRLDIFTDDTNLNLQWNALTIFSTFNFHIKIIKNNFY